VYWVLLFIQGMVLYVGIGLLCLAIALWLVSADAPRFKGSLSGWLSVMFWPLLPLLSPLGIKNSDSNYSRRSRPGRVGNEAVEPGLKDQSVERFGTIREAKDYLAGRIAVEAEREGTPLSDVERKMLYFSETGWTLPDILEVNAEFERDYDEGAYERKIAMLTRKIQAHDAVEDEQQQDAWDQAVLKLSRGDHYVTGLIDEAQPSGRGAPRWLRLLAFFLLLFLLGFLQNWSRQWFRSH